MQKVLKIAAMSLGSLVLTSSLVLAQSAPEPGSADGKTPTTSKSTTHKKGKKAGKKKGGKKKGGKKTATSEPSK